MNIKTIIERKHFHWLTAAQRHSGQGRRKDMELKGRMESAAVMHALAAGASSLHQAQCRSEKGDPHQIYIYICIHTHKI